MDYIKAIIIDDEPLSCELLALKLKKNFPEIQLLASFTSPKTALMAYKELQPDLVFLDIQMPVLDGFEWLQAISHIDFSVIFITAYDEYAIKAIRFNALDYLLKPVAIEELQAAIARFKAIKPDQHQKKLQHLLQQLNQPSAIALHTADSVTYVQFADIVYLQADGAYTKVFLTHQSPMLVSKNIGDFEAILPANQFFRTHQSYMVNLKQVAAFEKGEGGFIRMKNNSTVELSRRRKEAFLNQMNII